MLKVFIQQRVQNFVVITYDFIKNHMPFSDGEFVKVYIYLKFLLQNKVETIEINKIAQDLNLLESDVIKALEFWSERRLIKLTKDADGNITIDFWTKSLSLKRLKIHLHPLSTQLKTYQGFTKQMKNSGDFLNLLKSNTAGLSIKTI